MVSNITTWYDWPTNFSDGNVINGTGSFLQYANYVTSGGLGIAILVIIFIMSFFVGIAISSRKALLSSSFITFIFAVYLTRISMVSPVAIFILVLLMIVGAIGSKEESGM